MVRGIRLNGPVTLAGTAIIVLFAVAGAAAQTNTGEILGVVRDAQGGLLDTWVAIGGYGPTKATVIDGGDLFGRSR
jgi:hypothetical protein